MRPEPHTHGTKVGLESVLVIGNQKKKKITINKC